jgi:protein-S-isoprenylcysteine O-methyltransferase Ste14
VSENVFRIAAGLCFGAGLAISGYVRRKADRETGERVARSADGGPMLIAIRIGGLLLWLSPLVYLLNPEWMAWSRAGLPSWVRWVGVAIGAACTGLISWLLSSIGSGITPTGATRTAHALATSGPYRWVRHPLYTVGATFFVSFGMMADSWFIAMLGGLAFALMALRVPAEEANLIAKFGDEYRRYMERTGRYLPRLRKSLTAPAGSGPTTPSGYRGPRADP